MSDDFKTEVALLHKDIKHVWDNMNRIEAASMKAISDREIIIANGIREFKAQIKEDIEAVKADLEKQIANDTLKMSDRLSAVEVTVDKMSEKLEAIDDLVKMIKGIVVTFKVIGAVIIPLAGFVGWFVSHYNILGGVAP